MELRRFATVLTSVFMFAGILGQAHAQDPRIVGMWLFEEGSGNQVADGSGNGHTGIAVDGDLEWVAGKYGTALKFNHDNIRVHVEHNDAFNLETFTLECWVKLQSAGGDWQTVLAKRTAGADTTYVLEIG